MLFVCFVVVLYLFVVVQKQLLCFYMLIRVWPNMSIKLTDLHTSSPVQLYFWIVKTVQNRPRQVGDQRELGGLKGVFCIFEGWYYISKGSNWLGMKIGGTLRFFSSPKYVLVGTKSFCVSSNSFYGDPHCPRAVSTQKVCHSKFFSIFGRLWPR